MDEEEMNPMEIIRLQSEQHIDQYRMEREVFFNDLKDMIQTLPRENLETIRGMLHAVVHSDDVVVAAYYEGMFSAGLTLIHNVCNGCGEVHTPEDMLAEQEGSDAE